MNNIIGIYKITSPNGRIYIGQSVDIYHRWHLYKGLNFKQPKLSNSLKKHEYSSHKFEILQECSLEELDKLETHWKLFYLYLANWDWQKVLFCQLVDGKGGYKSEETKLRMSKGRTGILHSEETKLKISNNKNRAKNISIANKGKINSLEHRNKISMNGKGKIKLNNRKPVNQLSLDNIILNKFDSIKEAYLHLNRPIGGCISTCCGGRQKTAFGYKWEYKK